MRPGKRRSEESRKGGGAPPWNTYFLEGPDLRESCASNMCQSHNLYPPVEEDATLVTILKQAGAIPFVMTTASSSGSLETNSYLWGRAKNPLDPSRSPGGSSGGEAGLVASRASILGLAVDLGGSVRAPAAMCGVPGFFPT